MAETKAKKKSGLISHGVAAQNRKARFDYTIKQTVEAGLVLKGPERNHGLIDVPLVKAGPAGQEKMRTVLRDEEGEPEGRNARTRFMVLARAGKVAAWVGLMPLTGRAGQGARLDHEGRTRR